MHGRSAKHRLGPLELRHGHGFAPRRCSALRFVRRETAGLVGHTRFRPPSPPYFHSEEIHCAGHSRFAARLSEGETALPRRSAILALCLNGSVEPTTQTRFGLESRNTIRQGDTIESLRLAHDNGIKDTTRGAGAADTIHKEVQMFVVRSERYCT